MWLIINQSDSRDWHVRLGPAHVFMFLIHIQDLVTSVSGAWGVHRWYLVQVWVDLAELRPERRQIITRYDTRVTFGDHRDVHPSTSVTVSGPGRNRYENRRVRVRCLCWHGDADSVFNYIAVFCPVSASPLCLSSFYSWSVQSQSQQSVILVWVSKLANNICKSSHVWMSKSHCFLLKHFYMYMNLKTLSHFQI